MGGRQGAGRVAWLAARQPRFTLQMTDAASVLLVEDDAEIGALISRYLGTSQIAVTSVESGAAMDEAAAGDSADCGPEAAAAAAAAAR